MTTRRSLLKMGGAGIAATGALISGAAAWPWSETPAGNVIDPMTLVDPELRESARLIEENNAKFPALSDDTLAAIRTRIAGFGVPPLDSVPWTEQRVPGTPGNPDVRVYLINAKPGTVRPGIVYMHGGGFVFGDARSTLRELQLLCTALDCCVVSVDYRLAPETRYDGSIEDNYAALRWTFTHAAEIGVDPARIAVMGESAGGGHAALLALAARDRREVSVIFQMLIYPMLDDRTGTSRKVPPCIGTVGWRRDANDYGWRSFLGREPGGRSMPEGAVPARVADLRALPPAFIGVGSIDLFVDEDIAYAGRLIDAGVPAELHVVPGAYHGFDHNPVASIAKRFEALKLSALRRALQVSGAP